MANSKAPSAVRKPRHDFPLFPHASGRWAKKVRGKFCYFGKTADDPNGVRALDLWNDQKDDLLAGRTPRSKAGGLTVADLCNHFLTSKKRSLESGEIASRTFADYFSTCERIVANLGKGRLVADLEPADFDQLRATLSKTRGPVTLGSEIQRIRVCLKFAFDNGLVERPVRIGSSFKKPSKKVMRLERARKGEKMLEAAELRRLITAADTQMRAMILLGLNAGLGNHDVGTLELRHLDLENGWMNYPRPKTGVARRCWLWPETTVALRDVLAARKEPKDAAAKPLVFISRRGRSWARETAASPVGFAFRALLDKLGLHTHGHGFYCLRHVFRTVADGCLDQVATNFVMGHSDGSMAGAYRERIDDARLRAVAAHVRRWLLGEPVCAGAPATPATGTVGQPAPVKPKPKRPAAAVRAEGLGLRLIG